MGITLHILDARAFAAFFFKILGSFHFAGVGLEIKRRQAFAFHEFFRFFSGQGLPLDKSLGYAVQSIDILAQQLVCRADGRVYNALDLTVDDASGVFAMVAVGDPLSAYENLLALLAYRQGADHVAQTPFADHGPGEVGGSVDTFAVPSG